MPSDSSAVWDAVVIGAGPAGSIASYALARRGHSVLLVERASLPRDKACGGCLSPAALDRLARAELGDVPDAVDAQPWTHIEFVTARHRVRLPLPRPGRIVSRARFDAELARRAVHAGAVLRSDVEASLEPHTTGELRGVRLRTGSERQIVQARVVIAATGLMDLRHEGEPSAVAADARVGLSGVVPSVTDLSAGTVRMMVGAFGYAGLARRDTESCTLAAALDPNAVCRAHGPQRALTQLLTETQIGDGSIFDSKNRTVPDSSGWRGTPPMTKRLRTPSAHRLLFVGDAAGYVEPFTGEGIAWALASGWAAAPFVHEALATGWDDRIEQRWQQRHQALLGASHRRCRAMTQLLRHAWWRRGAMAALSRWPALAMPMLRRVMAPATW